MSIRVVYIVLSGLMATAAVLILNSYPEPQKVKVQADADLTSPLGTHDAVLRAMTQADTAQTDKLARLLAQIQTEADPANIKIKLAAPDAAPAIEQPAAEPARQPSLLGEMLKIDELKNAKVVAVLDLADGKIVESSDNAQAAILLTRIMAQNKSSGAIRHADNGHPMLALYHCKDEARHECAAVDKLKNVPLPADFSCEAARQNIVTCAQQHVDPSALFAAQGCTDDAAKQAIAAVLAQQTAADGVFDLDGKTYRFKKSQTESGCEVATIMPLPELPSAPVSGGLKQQKPLDVLLAVAGGLVFALIGFVCTKRRKEDNEKIEHQQIDVKALKANTEQSGKDRADIQKAQTKIDELQSRIKTMQSEADASAHKVLQLNEQLEYARSAFKKEQILRMSLDEEKSRLEDAVAAVSQRTVVDNPVNIIAADSQLPTKDKSAQNTELPPTEILPTIDRQASNTKDLSKETLSESDRITKNADSPILDDNNGNVQELFDAFSDDGWDEIAESFDSIMIPKGSAKSDIPKSPMEMLENVSASDDDSTFGMTGFLNQVKAGKTAEADKNEQTGNPRTGTESSLKPISDIPKLPSLPHLSTKLSGNLNTKTPVAGAKDPLKTNTLSGIASVTPPPAPKVSVPEHKAAPSTADLATRKQTDKTNESFRPAPSWTGKSVNDPGMDSNSLYDALKRRAKDVSEMNMPAAPDASGAFEFNRSLSRSGVFSLTGSRVDIDPMTDNEYFKLLYDQYVKTQKECGESSEKFTLEQFVSRLAREKERLMKSYQCKSVRFTVYVKDGKASLKATPQK